MLRCLFTRCAALVLLSLPIFGGSIAVDGSWHEFFFRSAPSAVVSCGDGCSSTTSPVAEQTSAPAWTFSGPATLVVLDLFLQGDRFQVFDNLASLGTTSVVINNGSNPCGGNIACALGDTNYSRVTFLLGAGPHSLTMDVIQNATGVASGAAAFQVSGVPEPGTMLLLGAGLVSLGLLRLRK
jgi:hypothetical protein